MKRLAILFLIAATEAGAASIEGDLAMGCRDVAYHRRIAKAAGAGDKDAVIALIEEGLKSKQCWRMPAGLRVRVEEYSFPYACVTKFGSTGPCQWVGQGEVNTRE